MALYGGCSVILFLVILLSTTLGQPDEDTPLPEVPLQLHGGSTAAEKSLEATLGASVGVGKTTSSKVPVGADPPDERKPAHKALATENAAEDVIATAVTPASDITTPEDVAVAPTYDQPPVIPAPDADQVITTLPPGPMGTTASGAEAVRRIGDDVAAVAQSYGKTPEALTELLLKDSDLRVDESKQLFYRCTYDTPLSAAADSGKHHHHHHRKLSQYNVDLTDPLPGSLAQSTSGVPLLHSRASATRKIYLDFDGHTTTGVNYDELNYRRHQKMLELLYSTSVPAWRCSAQSPSALLPIGGTSTPTDKVASVCCTLFCFVLALHDRPCFSRLLFPGAVSHTNLQGSYHAYSKLSLAVGNSSAETHVVQGHTSASGSHVPLDPVMQQTALAFRSLKPYPGMQHGMCTMQ